MITAYLFSITGLILCSLLSEPLKAKKITHGASRSLNDPPFPISSSPSEWKKLKQTLNDSDFGNQSLKRKRGSKFFYVKDNKVGNGKKCFGKLYGNNSADSKKILVGNPKINKSNFEAHRLISKFPQKIPHFESKEQYLQFSNPNEFPFAKTLLPKANSHLQSPQLPRPNKNAYTQQTSRRLLQSANAASLGIAFSELPTFIASSGKKPKLNPNSTISDSPSTPTANGSQQSPGDSTTAASATQGSTPDPNANQPTPNKAPDGSSPSTPDDSLPNGPAAGSSNANSNAATKSPNSNSAPATETNSSFQSAKTPEISTTPQSSSNNNANSNAASIDSSSREISAQAPGSGQTTTNSNSSVPRINISKSGTRYTFKIYNFAQPINIPNISEIAFPFSFEKNIVRDTILFTSSQTNFMIIPETLAVLVDFEEASNCVLPIFAGSRNGFPKIAVEGGASPPTFILDVDFIGGAGFVDPATESLDIYDFASSISNVSKGSFFSQKVLFRNAVKSQAYFGTVFCPFYKSGQSSFSGILQVSPQPKSLTTDPGLLNVYQELANPVFNFYVPYGGNHTIDMKTIPEDFTFKFNTTNADVNFAIEYLSGEKLTKEFKGPTKGTDTQFLIPKSKAALITVINNDPTTAAFLQMEVSSSSSSNSGKYIIIGVVVGVAVVAALAVFVWWFLRKRRREEILRINREQMLPIYGDNNLNYPIISRISPNSDEESPDGEKRSVGPLLTDELPDSQKLSPDIFASDDLANNTGKKIEIYTLNIDEFEEANSNKGGDEDNVIRQTKDKNSQ